MRVMPGVSVTSGRHPPYLRSRHIGPSDPEIGIMIMQRCLAAGGTAAAIATLQLPPTHPLSAEIGAAL
jgi:hypothetical protein